MESTSEDVHAKYKRLLALARNSLEANQVTLAQKDKQINQLTISLEEAKVANELLRQKSRSRQQLDDSQHIPRSFLRRIDVADIIWILVEYEGGHPDGWISFNNEEEFEDYIQRLPGGIPLTKPHRCLTVEESKRIESEAKVKVDRIVEEYRRYKVRVEISKKQKSSELLGSDSTTSASPTIYDTSISTSAQAEQEVTKWIQAYEKVTRENELLKTQAHQNILIKKWQDRYEEVLREKEELITKLKLVTRMNTTSSTDIYDNINTYSTSTTPQPQTTSQQHVFNFNTTTTATSGSASGNTTNAYNAYNAGSPTATTTTMQLMNGSYAHNILTPSHSISTSGNNRKTLEQSYLELRDEYKDYRRRVESALNKKSMEIQDLLALLDSHGIKDSHTNLGYRSRSMSYVTNTNTPNHIHTHDSMTSLHSYDTFSHEVIYQDMDDHTKINAGIQHGYDTTTTSNNHHRNHHRQLHISTTTTTTSTTNAAGGEIESDNYLHTHIDNNNNTGSSNSTGRGHQVSTPKNLSFSDSKIAYIRGMFLQYLSCKDPVVRPHIESALMAIFRYTEQEKSLIQDSLKSSSSEVQDTISVITNFLGTFTSTSSSTSSSSYSNS